MGSEGTETGEYHYSIKLLLHYFMGYLKDHFIFMRTKKKKNHKYIYYSYLA